MLRSIYPYSPSSDLELYGVPVVVEIAVEDDKGVRVNIAVGVLIGVHFGIVSTG